MHRMSVKTSGEGRTVNVLAGMRSTAFHIYRVHVPFCFQYDEFLTRMLYRYLGYIPAETVVYSQCACVDLLAVISAYAEGEMETMYSHIREGAHVRKRKSFLKGWIRSGVLAGCYTRINIIYFFLLYNGNFIHPLTENDTPYVSTLLSSNQQLKTCKKVMFARWGWWKNLCV
jgi:hypothetical protein